MGQCLRPAGQRVSIRAPAEAQFRWQDWANNIMTRGWNAALAFSSSVIGVVISADNRDAREAWFYRLRAVL